MLRTFLTLTLLLLLGPTLNADEKDEKKNNKPNHLIRESSPYLLQHAYNPVDWHPWGPEAFAKAKKEGKLIFLSIGYSSCHWCHVMEKESFSNKEVAELLNKNFICIKVDREERPDVDKIYMTSLQVQGQRGGWPLSSFLLPNGQPFVGGTYWPREDRVIRGQRVIGFKSILNFIVEAKKETATRQGIMKLLAGPGSAQILGMTGGPLLSTTQIATAFQTSLLDRFGLTRMEYIGFRVAEEIKKELEGQKKNLLFGLEKKHLTEAAENLKLGFDPVHGGFGSPFQEFRGTKFPTSPRLLFLHEQAQRDNSNNSKKILEVTLDHMALGGVYDQLGGGFHRYSTERTWTVPHFEKMLYDNGQLMEIYAAAYSTTKKPLYERVIRETLTFMERDMTSPEGGFYSALDADSEGEEGRFYVWTNDDLKKALPNADERKLLANVYGMSGEYNFEEKYHILVLDKPFADVAKQMGTTEEKLKKQLTPVTEKLFKFRSKRERPFRDTKILTAWNGLMIAGYAKAGEVLKDKTYVEAAEKAANFVLKNLRTDKGRLLRTYGAAPNQKAKAKLNAYLDDYAFLTHGLLNLYEATKDKKWLDEAKNLTATMIEHHWDKENDGFFFTSGDHEKFFARMKDQYDGARPSGNSMAARNLVRLWQLTGEKKYRDYAEKTMIALSSALTEGPENVTTLVSALGLYLDAKK